MKTHLLVLGCLTMMACRNTDVTKLDSAGADSEAPTDSGGLSDLDEDGDGYFAEEDCDDADAGVYPGATERCDGLDDDCDGAVDEGVATTWYGDGDGDGWGDDAAVEEACEAPEGYVADAGDCDDGDPAYNPGAPEEDCADPNDYNCDGSVGYADGDGDGFAACEECDDGDPAVFPGALEVCNGLDDDCDGAIDDADEGLDASTTTAWYSDGDGDGFGDPDALTQRCEAPEGSVDNAEDCDDGDAAVNPDAAEVCNSVDDDCDGAVDDADADVDLSTAGAWYADGDGDGYGDAASSSVSCEAPSGAVSDGGDCDDGDAAVNPGATEVCNSVDDDCDGAVDDDDSSLDASTASSWYADSDGDGFGDLSSSSVSCAQPSGAVTDSDDCDDGDGAVNPDASEVCNSVDDDCDGAVDDDDSSLDLSTGSTYYADSDGDGYGDAAVPLEACDTPSGHVSDDSDCNDSDASLFPESSGACASGATCKQILDDGLSTGDGTYSIDPDGAGAGLDAFDVTCDMSTDGGGWTEIPYSADLTYQRQFTGGDGWKWLPSDFTLTLSDAQIAAVQALSTEGFQQYVGLCNGVVHYYYAAGNDYAHTFGFEFLDGSATPFAVQSYSPYDVTVTQDGCINNGGEGGTEANATLFEIRSVSVPVINVYSRDNGDSGELFGSPLTANPAWLR